MLTVLTLGGAAVVSEPDGPDLPGATQRRTLALLGVLAVASTHGMSRDKLIALFWPDAEPDRASHSLTQALYAARRGLDCDDLFLLGNEIRLNPERIRSDVAMFEAAFSSGRFEEATALYRGAFLDGFYLTGSAGFERWQSIEQARLETIAVEAFDRLAEHAEQNGDFRKAADWLRRLAAIRPLDSGIAVRFMESLALSGDRAGALRHGYVHSELLRQELELTPDEHVADLTARIREGTFGRRPAARIFGSDRAAGATPSIAPNPTRESVVTTEAPPTTSVPPLIDHSIGVHRSRGRATLWISGIATTLVGGAIAVGTIRDTPAVVVSPSPQSIVVMPFRVSGANPSLAYMQDGMVELLSPRLESDSGTRSIDAGAVLGALRRSPFGNQPDAPRDSLIRLAARLGAERVVLGNVVGTGGRFLVQATVFRTANASVIARASAEGTVDSLPRAIDFLAAKLLVSEAGEDPALVVHGVPSLPALRAFLAGQSAARRGSYAAALRWFREAISRDST
ncbi:MAG TPA: BTAD domain-containing putative transcriptional regulator, partial [Gemmatimonadaceae bacterium]